MAAGSGDSRRIGEGPVIGIACGVDDLNVRTRRAYARCVRLAGGVPVLLAPPDEDEDAGEAARRCAALCAGLVLTGGGDPATERWGEPTHERASVEPAARQRFDEALLVAADADARIAVLGVCLGMQMMALHRGGRLVQHMPERVPTHEQHTDDRTHEIAPEPGVLVPGPGLVTSWHHQCVDDPGGLSVAARAPDGVIEAVVDPSRPFYLGVQWHPERTAQDETGMAIFRALVDAAAGAAR